MSRTPFFQTVFLLVFAGSFYSDHPENHINDASRIKSVVDKHNSKIEIYITELNMDLGGISVEERAYISKRAAGLGAILNDSIYLPIKLKG